MFIPLHLQPTFIADQVELFIKNLQLDFSLRFAEVRKRKRIEAQLETGQPVKIGHIEEVMGIDSAEGVISLIDWPELVIWHESFTEFTLQQLLHNNLNDIRYRELSASSEIGRLALQRLSEIDSILASTMMGNRPRFFKALLNRWKLRILFEESRFLVQLLKEI